jgi:hypothetical protein
MPLTRYHGRRAAVLENDVVRVTVLEEGGHIAEICHKAAGVNPLWTPPWTSIEPSLYDPVKHVEYGDGVDAKLLAGIMGHNLCLDIFGGPSHEEATAGLPVHGEASTVRYDIHRSGHELLFEALLPIANLEIERHLMLEGTWLRIRETVHNMTGTDRPIGWTQHVTLGPPFLARGATEFRSSAMRSKVFETTFGPADYLVAGAEFDWPLAPRSDGGVADLRWYTDAASSSAYTAHLMDRSRDWAFFSAFSPQAQLAIGYVWRPAEFPWLGRWEENASRPQPPWNGSALTIGLEFGVSPFPESRREMIDRGRLFDVPTYCWIPADSRVSVEYWATVQHTTVVSETLEPPQS